MHGNYRIMLNLSDYLQIITYGLEKPARFTNYLRTGCVSRTFVIVSEEKKLVYIVNPKVASTSIAIFMAEIFLTTNELNSTALKQRHKLLNKIPIKSYEELAELQNKGYFVFSFVRNPFARIVSFFRNKFEKDKFGIYRPTGFAINKAFKGITSFADVVHRISRMPDAVSDSHFMSQALILKGKGMQFIPDFIGRLENFEIDFNLIRQRFSSESVPQENTTNLVRDEWMDYYDKRLAGLVYLRFQSDFQTFGYEDEWIRVQNRDTQCMSQ